MPAWIVGIQLPWRAFFLLPHVPVFWIPAVPAGMTVLEMFRVDFVRDWRLLWLLLLLPVALFLPALPIDETRYLAVAWEMRSGGDWLLLHLNGAPYSDKGPLLFWLANAAWLVAGIHVWIVRLGILIASLVSLVLFERLARRLSGDAAFASR